MRLTSIGTTLGIYLRWGWLNLEDPARRAHLRRCLSHPGPVTFRMHSPGLGLFAHLNWCLWLAGWAEQEKRLCHYECTSPNYRNDAGPRDWLQSILRQKAPAPGSRSRHIAIRRWEWMPYTVGSGIPTSLTEARDLFHRNFAVADPLLQRARKFIAAHFDGHFIIGLHYRGTDKHIEASKTTYEDAIAAVDRAACALAEAGVSPVAVFVATDEQPFLEAIQQRLPHLRILMVQDALRSLGTEPLHGVPSSEGLRKAEEAMLDALLLGASDLLIKTASTLSAWAPIVGKAMPVVLLSKPFARCNWFPDAIIAGACHHMGAEAQAVTAALAEKAG